MDNLFMLLWLGCSVATLYFLIQGFRKKGRKRKALLPFIGGFIALVLFGMTTSSSSNATKRQRSNTPPSNATPQTSNSSNVKPNAPEIDKPDEKMIILRDSLVSSCATDIVASYSEYAPSVEAVKTVIPAKIDGEEVRA